MHLRPLATLALGAAALLAAACGEQQGAAGGPTAPVTPVLNDVVLGKADAPVEVIEYASFTCPHCRDFYKQDFPRLKANYIDTGKVKYIYRDFPTDASLAVMLVSVSRCKGPDPYYALVDDIFGNQIELFEAAQEGKAGPLLIALGQRHGITEPELRACLTHKGINDFLNKTVEGGKAKGVDQTPTVFVNGEKLENHLYPALSAAIDKAMGVTPTETPAAPAAPAEANATTPATGAPVSIPKPN